MKHIEPSPDTIILCEKTWGKDNIAQIIGNQLITLLKESEYCKVYEDGDGIYVIEHGHNEDKEYWGIDQLIWLTASEGEMIDHMRTEEFNSEEHDD